MPRPTGDPAPEEDPQLREWLASPDSAEASQSDGLSRLLADAELLADLQEHGFTDEDWEPVSAEFARYGLSVLTSWIRKATIYGRVKEKTGFALASPEAGVLDGEAIQDLATDTVLAALPVFRSNVLMKHRWDPAKGASMKTFFIGQCLFRFPNVYRTWIRNWRRRSRIVYLDEVTNLDSIAPAIAPADHFPLQRMAVQDALSMLSVDDARRAFALRAMGYTLEEIAQDLGMANEKAVENLLGYQRRRVQRISGEGVS